MNENMTLNQNTGMATQPMQPVQQPVQPVQNVAVAQPVAQPAPVAAAPVAPAVAAPVAQPVASAPVASAPVAEAPAAAEAPIVNDVSIKVESADPNAVKKQIIVNGEDITYLPVEQLTEAMADLMTDEQAEEYIKGFSEEEIEKFREIYGFIIQAPKMTEEELAERDAKRQAMAGGLNGGAAKAAAAAQSQAAAPAKTEQTGAVIFGVRN